MATEFIGKWKMESTENFEAYMKAVGVGMLTAKLGATAKPNVIISVDNDQWKIRSETSFKTSEAVFKLNEEFQETTADGRKVMTTFTLDGPKKLIQNQKADVPSTITRELIDPNTMVVLCQAKDVTSKRVYKRA